MKIFCVVALAALAVVNSSPILGIGGGGGGGGGGGVGGGAGGLVGGLTGGLTNGLGGGGGGPLSAVGGLLGGKLGGKSGGLFTSVGQLLDGILSSVLGLGGAVGGGDGGEGGGEDGGENSPDLSDLKACLGGVFAKQSLLSQLVSAVLAIESLKLSIISEAISDLSDLLDEIVRGTASAQGGGGGGISVKVIAKLKLLPRKLHKCSVALDSLQDNEDFVEKYPKLADKLPAASEAFESASGQLPGVLAALHISAN